MKKKRFFPIIDKALFITCIIFITAIILLVLLQVFSRYVLQLPIKGTEELARLVFVWACFCGAALATLRGEHVRVDFLMKKIPCPTRLWMHMGISMLVASTGAIMSVSGTIYVIEKWMYPDYSTALLYPRSLFWAPVPLAGLIISGKNIFLTFHYISQITRKV